MHREFLSGNLLENLHLEDRAGDGDVENACLRRQAVNIRG
jgi:hypothetical protein